MGAHAANCYATVFLHQSPIDLSRHQVYTLGVVSPSHVLVWVRGISYDPPSPFQQRQFFSNEPAISHRQKSFVEERGAITLRSGHRWSERLHHYGIVIAEVLQA
jgi:hypothetical protein